MSLNILLLALFYLLIIVLALPFLVTVFPLDISFLSNVDGFYYDATVGISVLLGLLNGSTDIHPEGGSFKLSVLSYPVYSSSWAGEEAEPEEKPVDKPRKMRRGNSRALVKPVKRLIDSSIRIVKVKKLDVSLTAGLSDPYASGMIFGAAFPCIEMLRIYCPKLSISLTPVFVEERFASRVSGGISMRMILFLVPMLRFFLSKGYRRYRK